MTRYDVFERNVPTAAALPLAGFDGRIHVGAVLAATLPAIGILAAAVAFLSATL